MKKLFKKLVCVVICFSVLMSLVSCDLIEDLLGSQDPSLEEDEVDENNSHSIFDNIVPEGYTGGISPDKHLHYEYGFYWLETYEEVLQAAQLAKSHGGSISRTVGITCDGEPYDVKWLFEYRKQYAEPLKEGASFFDRDISGWFLCYVFRKDVTIEELNYSDVSSYDELKFTYYTSSKILPSGDVSDLSIDWWGKDRYGFTKPLNGYPYEILYNGEAFAEIEFDNDMPLSDEYLNAILNSLVFIE